MQDRSSPRARRKTLPPRRGHVDRLFAALAGTEDLPPENITEVITEIGPAIRTPKTRAECAGIPRPCPFVSCKWHLYLDVDPKTGTLKFNYPGKEPLDLEESCALDVADAGGALQRGVAALLGIEQCRVSRIETRAVAKLRAEVENRPGLALGFIESSTLVRFVKPRREKMPRPKETPAEREARARAIHHDLSLVSFQEKLAAETRHLDVESEHETMAKIARRLLRRLGHDMTGFKIMVAIVPSRVAIRLADENETEVGVPEVAAFDVTSAPDSQNTERISAVAEAHG